MTLGIRPLSVCAIVKNSKVANVYRSVNGCRYGNSSRHFRNRSGYLLLFLRIDDYKHEP